MPRSLRNIDGRRVSGHPAVLLERDYVVGMDIRLPHTNSELRENIVASNPECLDKVVQRAPGHALPRVNCGWTNLRHPVRNVSP